MSYKKNIVPITLAVLLHLAIIAALLWNFAFVHDDSKKQFVDAPVKARLVTAPETPKKDASSLKKRQQKQRELEEAKKKLEQKKLEEQRQQEQEKLEQQKQLEREKQLEQERKVAEQKKLDEQKKAEVKKKRLAEEAEKKRKAEQERQKKEAEKKRLAEEKRKKAEAARKKREAEARKRRELEEQLANLDDELFEADKGDVRQSQVMNEVEKIKAAIGAKIRRNWFKPGSEGSCSVAIQMGPGGVLLGTSDNGGDFDYCESGILAIQKSAPFPSSDDPEVMQQLKDITITFDPSFKQ